MIRIIGIEGSSEYEAGRMIRDALKAYWPKIEETPAAEENVIIACNAKLAGYQVQDFDVVLCAKLRPGRRFAAVRPVRASDNSIVSKQPIAVTNLLVAIEVKDHDPAGVQIANGSVLVRYTRGQEKWSNATDQNIAQVHALKQYFLDQQISLYVRPLLVMRGLTSIEAPGAVPGQFTATELLTEIASTAPVYMAREPILSSCNAETIDQVMKASIFIELKPSFLDRQRMDRIVSRRGLSEEWFETMGDKLLTLRGRGGTGKTVLLLQAAWRAYDEDATRTLLLTYNLALVADIRRTMALMNIPGSAPESGITVESVMAFTLAWIKQLAIVDEGELYNLEQYDAHCKAANEYLRSGAVTPKDIQEIKDREPERFSFDFVMADEGQDWPQDEAEILKLLYGTNRLVTADGVDQLLRGQRCDWQKGIPENERKLVRLRRCLRMKSNLAAFANGIAKGGKIAWDTEPNPDGPGGRVIVLQGSYAVNPDFHRKLVAEAKQAGNELIDFLVCVPAADVVTKNGKRGSQLGAALKSMGCEIWDATSRDVRRDFARTTDTLRVVQYQSCRGLEGWTVIAEHLDIHWQQCFDQFMNENGSATDLFKSPEEAAASDAWYRTLIPLTRSIDTLVITLFDPRNVASETIMKAATRYRDFVELPSL